MQRIFVTPAKTPGEFAYDAALRDDEAGAPEIRLNGADKLRAPDGSESMVIYLGDVEIRPSR